MMTTADENFETEPLHDSATCPECQAGFQYVATEYDDFYTQRASRRAGCGIATALVLSGFMWWGIVAVVRAWLR